MATSQPTTEDNMKVYIVMKNYDYEGYCINTVCATLEAAEQAKAELEADSKSKWIDDITIQEYEVRL